MHEFEKKMTENTDLESKNCTSDNGDEQQSAFTNILIVERVEIFCDEDEKWYHGIIVEKNRKTTRC